MNTFINKIIGEEPFRYLGTNGRFAISAPRHQYTLHYSVDGEQWTPVGKPTPVGENHIVVNAPTGMFFMCDGLPSDEMLEVTY